ncbi:hypothetical protein ABBQ32_012283 [Trebouxia sp. C0010 RCD-2024]
MSKQATRPPRFATCSAKAELKWQEVATQPSQKPLPPRSGHCGTSLPPGSDEQALIFGGYTEDETKQRAATNDTWVFSVEHGSWSQKDVTSDLPRARIASQAVCGGQYIWLIGGWDPGSNKDGGEILSDIWRLDTKSWAWSEVHTHGSASLQPISRFQAAVVGSKVYIHTHRSINDILVLDVADPNKPHLTKVSVSSTAGGTPSARGLHSVTAVGSKLYLFGGAPQKGGMLNDLWLLDTASMQWTELQPKGQLPHVRCSHTAVVMGTSIVIFGGSYYRVDGSGLQPLDDVYSYSTLDNTWQKQTTTGQGPSARNAAIACVVADNEMLLHGGWDPFRQTYSDSFILQCEATG